MNITYYILTVIILLCIIVNAYRSDYKNKRSSTFKRDEDSSIKSLSNSSKFENRVIENKYLNESKIVGISYANDKYKRNLECLKKSAFEVGKVDEFFEYGPEDIDDDFKQRNIEILNRERGNGYWLWKPYFILKTLKKLNYGDYLIYTDSAIIYENDSRYLRDFLNSKNADMWVYRLPNIEKAWTKRDIFLFLNADSPYYTDTPQFNAAIQIYKKSNFTLDFLEELLYFSQYKTIITDDPNRYSLPNYKEFKDNRHDQSMLSIMIKKYNLANSGQLNMTISDIQNLKNEMPYIFCHYRRRKFTVCDDIKDIC